MSFKTTYILFGILVGLLLVLGIALWLDPLPVSTDSFVLPSAHDPRSPLKWGDITRVEVERGEGEPAIVYQKDPQTNRWRIESPLGVEGDTFAIEQLVQQVLDAERVEDASLPAADQLGLSPPRKVITLKQGDERSVQLHVGEASLGEEHGVVYVTSSDRPDEPMAVKKSRLDSVLKDLVAFRSRDVLPASSADYEEITVTRAKDGKPEGPTIKLVKKGLDRWYFTEPFEGEADTATPAQVTPAGQPPNGMKALLADLSSLRVEFVSDRENDFVANGVTEPELAQYNLAPADDILTITVKRSDAGGKSSTATLRVGVAKTAGEKEQKYFARQGDQLNIVKVDAGKIGTVLELLEQPEALRDRRLIALGEGVTPDAIQIRNDHGLLELYRPDSLRPWELYRDDSQTGADDQMVTGLLALLGQEGQVASFPDPATSAAELGLDKPTAVVSLWVDGLKKPEADDKEKKSARPQLKNADQPTVRLTFGKWEKDKKVVAVKQERAGEPAALMKVKEVVIERVLQGPLAYMDRRLAQLNEGAFDATQNVTRVEIDRAGKKVVVTREAKEGAEWKIEQPTDLAGRKADPDALASILNPLNRLTASRLIAEKPTEQALQKEYGLAPPRARVAVTLTREGKAATYEYLFGKDVGGSEVFARQGGAFGRDMVFTVDAGALKDLDRDLLDPTVFSFDPQQVRGLKLIGWQNQSLTGFPATLDLESKDGTDWTLKNAASFNFTLDDGKVRGFLSQLSRLRAESFVGHGVKPEAAQELELARGALMVEIKLEGSEKPLQLTVGKLDGDQGYFAISPQLPGDVFRVGKAIFEGPKSKPGHFGS